MNFNSEKLRYKKVSRIEEVGNTLKGKKLKFTFGNETKNPSQILLSSEEIPYYTEGGEPATDTVSNIKVGDYLIEYI